MCADRISPPLWAARSSLTLAAAGLAISGYLTLEHYTSRIPLACPESGTINCTKVTTSSQSAVVGIPVAVLGLLWFITLVPLLLPAAWRRAAVTWPRLVLTAAGVPGVLYLVYVELFDLRAICLYCTAVHVVAVLLFAIVAIASAITWPA